MYLEIPFFVIEGKYKIGDETHIGYGVSCYFKGTCLKYEDLSTSRERVEVFVQCCNKLSLSPAHLKYVVKDFFVKELWEATVGRNERVLTEDLEELRNEYLEERDEQLEEIANHANERKRRPRR